MILETTKETADSSLVERIVVVLDICDSENRLRWKLLAFSELSACQNFNSKKYMISLFDIGTSWLRPSLVSLMAKCGRNSKLNFEIYKKQWQLRQFSDYRNSDGRNKIVRFSQRKTRPKWSSVCRDLMKKLNIMPLKCLNQYQYPRLCKEVSFINQENQHFLLFVYFSARKESQNE